LVTMTNEKQSGRPSETREPNRSGIADARNPGRDARNAGLSAAAVELRLEHDSVLELRDGVPVRRHYFPFADTKAKLRECMRELAAEIRRES
jgi:hypothetical protein